MLARIVNRRGPASPVFFLVFFFLKAMIHSITLTCILYSCSLAGDDDSSFSILSYNVQTLFDDVSDGDEFSGYDPAIDSWDTSKYHIRLERLARVIRDSTPGGPDVIVFQELEHAEILDDLNRYFLGDLGYHYCEASGVEGVPMQTAIMTRQPMISAYARAIQSDGINLRPLIEVSLEYPGIGIVHVIGFHWKSKASGTAEETETLRLASSSALMEAVGRLRRDNPDDLIICAGDANENIDEYWRVGGAYVTALMPLAELEALSGTSAGEDSFGDLGGANGTPPLSIPVVPIVNAGVPAADSWFIHFWEDGGSYWFDGGWESIDQILVEAGGPGAALAVRGDFTVLEYSYLLNSDGEPRRYSSYNGSGYSDHLPVLLTLPVP